LQPFFNLLKIIRLSHNLENVAFLFNIFSASLEHKTNEPIFIDLGFLNCNKSPLVEHPRDTTGFAQIAPVFREEPPYLGDSAIFVVRKHLRQNRSSTWTITFVLSLLVCNPFELTGAFFDSAIDVLSRHTVL